MDIFRLIDNQNVNEFSLMLPKSTRKKENFTLIYNNCKLDMNAMINVRVL